MKNIFGLFFLLWSCVLVGQIPPYYNGVNLTLTGMPLKSELSQKITNTHTTTLMYNDLWAVLQLTDVDPTNNNDVLLVYGYNDADSNPTTDRTRSKTNFGGNIGQWNREHTYAKSLGTPDLGTSGPGADAHHIRSSDVQMNNNRGSRKFAAGSGNAGNTGANWYPGNEWKGDVARMMMYMYLRYPSQCKPDNVGVGTSVSVDPSMINLFLQWNAEDTVSAYETNRNNILESHQGNRNPFIDNPYLATIIWGGQVAQDKWNMTGLNESELKNTFTVYPNPSSGSFNIQYSYSDDVDLITVYNIEGKQVKFIESPKLNDNKFNIIGLPKGFFVLKTIVNQETITRKLIVH